MSEISMASSTQYPATTASKAEAEALPDAMWAAQLAFPPFLRDAVCDTSQDVCSVAKPRAGCHMALRQNEPWSRRLQPSVFTRIEVTFFTDCKVF